jgi:tetratricopeptide (TPR) repeat protein
MRNVITMTVLAFLSLAPFSEGLAEESSRAFTMGSQAFAEGDYLRALAYFEDAREAGVDGPAVHYNIAVCHYRLGNYKQAEGVFRFIANRYPEMGALAEYNLGLVLLRQAREDEARPLFERARQESSDEKIAQLAAAALRRLDSAPESAAKPPRWVSLVDFNVGHDDNVALLDESSVPAGQSVESAFTEALAVISGPLSDGSGFRFNGGAYTVRYNDAGEFDQTAVRLGGAYHWATRAWRMEAESHFNHTTLDGDGFEQRLGVGLDLKRNLSSTTTFGVQLVHDEVDGVEPQFAYLEGSRELLGVSLDRYGISGRLTLAYQFESNDRASASVAPTRNRVALHYRYTMSPGWNADFGLSFRSSAYDDLAVPRDEDLTELALGVQRNFARGLRFNGTYRWSDNGSNVDTFSYTRSRLSLGVGKSF